jgi:tripartite-type tricarboxylate transporter receptor subunit TctC
MQGRETMRAISQVVVAAALAWVGAIPAWAQDYPTAPVHLVSGFPAGTTADISARVVGAKIGQILGQQFVVENRPGAASSLAGAAVARAPKDGYTLYVGSAANIINAAMNPNLTFDFIKDFAPITLLTSTPTVLVVNPELGVKNVKDLVALAKAKPDSISFGSSGVASSTHLALELLKSLANVKITHVPYTGSPQVVTDLLGGRIHGYFSPASTVMGHVRAGTLVALGVTDAKRSTFIPELPTMVESGVPDCVSVLWFGIAAPAGTPAPIVERLHKEIVAALRNPAMQERFAKSGARLVGNTPQEFAAQIRTERVRWGEIIKAAGIKAE